MSVSDNFSSDDFSAQGGYLFVNGLTESDIERCIEDGFIAVREKESGRLLFRYNSQLNQVEIQRRTVKTVIDLKKYQRSAMSDKEKIEELERDILQLKCAVKNNLISAKVAQEIDPRQMSIAECTALIRDVSFEYTRVRSALSALSATSQGGLHEHTR